MEVVHTFRHPPTLRCQFSAMRSSVPPTTWLTTCEMFLQKSIFNGTRKLSIAIFCNECVFDFFSVLKKRCFFILWIEFIHLTQLLSRARHRCFDHLLNLQVFKIYWKNTQYFRMARRSNVFLNKRWCVFDITGHLLCHKMILATCSKWEKQKYNNKR